MIDAKNYSNYSNFKSTVTRGARGKRRVDILGQKERLFKEWNTPATIETIHVFNNSCECIASLCVLICYALFAVFCSVKSKNSSQPSPNQNFDKFSQKNQNWLKNQPF